MFMEVELGKEVRKMKKELKCPKCGQCLTLAEEPITNNPVIYFAPQLKSNNVDLGNGLGVHVYACKGCGYLEFYAVGILRTLGQ